MKNKKNMPQIVNRSRVNNILSEMFKVPLFFISASMGYGKTTSVKNFLKMKKDVKAIYLDYEDSNDIWNWNKFCSLIKGINLYLGKKLIEYGVPENNHDAYKVIKLIRHEIKQKTVLVIDDWKDTNSCINYLIKNAAIEEIPDFYIVIISRNKPSDNYMELELKQKCIVMSQEDLAFNFDETEEFFEINGVILNDKEKKKYINIQVDGFQLHILRYYSIMKKRLLIIYPKQLNLLKKLYMINLMIQQKKFY